MPSRLYAATYHGAFKSTDGGDTWNAANTGLPDNSSVTALAIDPNTPSTLYVSSYSEVTGGAVYKSTDGGDTWNVANTGLPDNTVVTALAIDPTTPRTLYAATYGVFKSSVFKSTDAGATWGEADAGLTDPSVFTLAIEPLERGRTIASFHKCLTIL